ncbi:MAG: GNAT family N-acetyltransferase [Pseudomonadota bacterium]
MVESVKIVEASAGRMADYVLAIPDLVFATGPISYGYQFGADRQVFDALIMASWQTNDTLFAAATSRIALVDGELAGVEIGFKGANFYPYKTNLATAATPMIASGQVPYEMLAGVIERADKASYLNAHVHDDVYYLHALSVFDRFRGAGIGLALLDDAKSRAKAAGFRELQLDVLADNPAVRFYLAQGLRVVVETVSPELTKDHGFPSELRMAIAL